MSDPRPIAEGLERVARHLGGPPPKVLGAVFGRWQAIVGDAIAAHTRPASVAGGVLVVEVDDPGWATQLRYLSQTLLEQVREAAGTDVVERIEVRVKRP